MAESPENATGSTAARPAVWFGAGTVLTAATVLAVLLRARR